ncbi:MAG: T9SS C-terminal target domain-containing protein [Verrucomicrobia bacterium]|nr:T9SS C-terminal target domain-containing protein [Verrucomicrobiota bacterium]
MRAISPILISAWLATPSFAGAAELRVDLNPPDPRKDVLTPHWENWSWTDAKSASQKFGDVTVTLRGADDATLRAVWFKGLIDFGVRMGLDGITAKDPSSSGIEMILSGLSPGRHTLVTYHNEVRDIAPAAFDVFIGNARVVTGMRPTKRATNDYDVASVFLEMQAEANKDVVVRFRPQTPDSSCILNGFELDTADPHRKAIKPSPANDDEHWQNEAALTWTAPALAKTHLLFFGADSNAVARATTASPEFRVKLTEARFPLPPLDHMLSYFWRVDEVTAGGEATRGDVWRFRTRHLAFPTAEGYGRFAIGGRGGRVIEVTNLDDYDPVKGDVVIPGSFRAAVEADGPRTIIFRVSGLIKLKRPCAVSKPYCTLAGQTAPGDGICLANYSSGAYGTHDVIIRFMRFRVGDFARKAMDGAGLGSCDHCIVDHCSISWSSDEGTSSRGAKNITFQRNIVAEALHHSYHYRASDRTKFETHAFAGSISGGIGSFHHNLLAHCTDRNWSLAGGLTQSGKYAGRLDIRNNVVFNWTARTTDGGVRELNYVNNYYKPFPGNPFVKWLLKLDALNPAWGTEQYYMTGNVMEGFVNETNNWSAFANGAEIEKQVRVDAPIFESFVTTHTAHEAFTNVLADVGATFPRQDVIDRRIIEEARTGTTHYTGTRGPTYGDRPGRNFAGIIDEPTDNKDAQGSPNFPWPEYKSAFAPLDSDHDGIPDDWEKARGLNPDDPRDANASGAEGYTHLEKYLGWLVGEFPDLKPAGTYSSQTSNTKP